MIKTALLSVSIFGMMVFALVFAATFANQKAIVDSAKSFIVSKAKDKFDAYQPSDSTQKILEKLRIKNSEELAELKAKVVHLDDSVIMTLVDSVCKSKQCDLEEKKTQNTLKEMIHSGYQASIQDASTLLYNLDDILKNEAKEVIHALLTDLRIFTATNFAIFFLIFLLTISVNAALLKALSLPAGLLTIADSIASFTYLFEQNWFYTILYNNYWGVGYIVFVGMLFSFLLDITFNKGKGTMNLLLAITGD